MLALLAISPLWAAESYFDAEGVRVYFTDEGQGDPVVLIHGFSASGETNWRGPGIIQGLLEAGFRVITVDNRGHGKSDKPHEVDKYGVEMVKDVVRLLDHLGLRKAHVAGYSMGGFITNKLREMYPDRLATAMLGGAGWSRPGQEMPLVKELAESLENGQGFGPLLRALTPEGAEPPSEEQIQQANQRLAAANDVKALAAVMRAMPTLAVPEDNIRANQVPTLAIIGGADPLKPGVDALDPIMRRLEIFVIPQADHMTAFTNQMFVGAYKQFLARHPL